MVAYLDIDATLSAEDCTFWQDILYRCLDDPSDVLEGREQESNYEDVEIQPVKSGTLLYLDKERYLCGGYSEDDYAADFQKAMACLTKGTALDFKVSLSLYFLEHDPDLHLSFDRQDLAA